MKNSWRNKEVIPQNIIINLNHIYFQEIFYYLENIFYKFTFNKILQLSQIDFHDRYLDILKIRTEQK